MPLASIVCPEALLCLRMCVFVEPRLLQLEAGVLSGGWIFVSSYPLCGLQIFRKTRPLSCPQDSVGDHLSCVGEMGLFRPLRSYLLSLVLLDP